MYLNKVSPLKCIRSSVAMLCIWKRFLLKIFFILSIPLHFLEKKWNNFCKFSIEKFANCHLQLRYKWIMMNKNFTKSKTLLFSLSKLVSYLFGFIFIAYFQILLSCLCLNIYHCFKLNVNLLHNKLRVRIQ